MTGERRPRDLAAAGSDRCRMISGVCVPPWIRIPEAHADHGDHDPRPYVRVFPARHLAAVETDTAWSPPTVPISLHMLTYGRHAAPLTWAVWPSTGTPTPGCDESAEERADTDLAPARERRWRAARSAVLRLGGRATERSA